MSWPRALVAIVLSSGCSYPQLDFATADELTDATVSDSSSDTPEDTRPPTLAEACAAYASAWCGRLETCGLGELRTKYGTTGQCAARVELHCVSSANAKSSPPADPSAIAACAAARASVSCNNLYDDLVGCPSGAGTLPNGAKCAYGNQCVGEKCAFAGSSCGTCATGSPDRGLDQTCSTQADCSPVLVCRGGKCAAPRALGEACTPGTTDDCGAFEGRYCDPTSKTCKEYQYESDGGPCGALTKGWTVCLAGNCVTPSGGVGSCRAAAAEGSACTDRPCLFPAVCAGGLCVLPDPTKC
jgi:hypothetical protein